MLEVGRARLDARCMPLATPKGGDSRRARATLVSRADIPTMLDPRRPAARRSTDRASRGSFPRDHLDDRAVREAKDDDLGPAHLHVRRRDAVPRAGVSPGTRVRVITRAEPTMREQRLRPTRANGGP